MVLGAEGPGPSRLAAERCDVLASIPLRGELASLNVAAAAAVACFEIARRRFAFRVWFAFVGCDWYRRRVATGLPRLYVYVVTHDGGHAPNPFHGFCTLATCKPQIRKKAQIGDWIAGIDPKQKGRNRRLIYAMCVDKDLDFDEYWNDLKFRQKRPKQAGSLMERCGDNYYHRSPNGSWIQEPGDHSNEDGSQNMYHTYKDTRIPRVLISNSFVYYGANSIEIPDDLCDRDDSLIQNCGRGHRCNFSESLRHDFIDWLETQIHLGIAGNPKSWPTSEFAEPPKKSSSCSAKQATKSVRRSRTC